MIVKVEYATPRTEQTGSVAAMVETQSSMFIPAAIIEAQSADVDVVAGATKTSEALIAAVKDALSQVK